MALPKGARRGNLDATQCDERQVDWTFDGSGGQPFAGLFHQITLGIAMAHLIEFRTSKFDPKQEPPNPVNPIAGRSILVWLRENVLPGAIEPDYEDWGWYTEARYQGSSYLIGGICFMPEDDSSGPPYDWMIQIHKHRSLTDKLLGRNKLQPNDPLVAKISGALRSDPGFAGIRETSDA